VSVFNRHMRDLAIPTETLKFIISSKMNHFTWIIAPASVAEGEHDLKLEVLSEEPACRKARSTGIVMVASNCLGGIEKRSLGGQPTQMVRDLITWKTLPFLGAPS
jgi:hypothetical protein